MAGLWHGVAGPRHVVFCSIRGKTHFHTMLSLFHMEKTQHDFRKIMLSLFHMEKTQHGVKMCFSLYGTKHNMVWSCHTMPQPRHNSATTPPQPRRNPPATMPQPCRNPATTPPQPCHNQYHHMQYLGSNPNYVHNYRSCSICRPVQSTAVVAAAGPQSRLMSGNAGTTCDVTSLVPIVASKCGRPCNWRPVQVAQSLVNVSGGFSTSFLIANSID